jgi:hypothetical protein
MESIEREDAGSPAGAGGVAARETANEGIDASPTVTRTGLETLPSPC